MKNRLTAALAKLWGWLRPKLTRLFVLTAKNVAQEVLTLLNDAALQRAALAAVQAAAENGLKGNDAFEAALNTLTQTLKAQGRELAGNVKDTLIQNAYCVFRNTAA